MTVAPGIGLAGRQLQSGTVARPASAAVGDPGRTPADPTASATSAGDDIGVLQHLLPGQRSARQAIGNRLRQVLDEHIARECCALVDRRLHQMPDPARAALLPSASVRNGLARAVLAGLHPAALVELLSPAVEDELALLLRLPGMGDPMLREAALDVLSGTPRAGVALDHVRAGCLTLLGPGLALLGADRDPSTSGRQDRPGATQAAASRELTVLAALGRDDPDSAVRTLALHAGVDEAQALDAVWTRDVRSLLGLAWRAGYSMRAALLLQTRLAGVPRPLALGPTKSGGSPLGRGEIAWQLAMLAAA